MIHWIHVRGATLVVNAQPSTPEQNTSREPAGLPLLWPIFITIAVLTGFLMGIPPALVASAGGALLLVRRTRDPREIYGDVDWSLLVLFLGLFLILGGAEQAGVTTTLLHHAEALNLSNSVIFVSTVALLSTWSATFPRSCC